MVREGAAAAKKRPRLALVGGDDPVALEKIEHRARARQPSAFPVCECECRKPRAASSS